MFFFLGEKRKSGREALFWPNFRFFLGQKSGFSPTFSRFFGIFLAHFWVSRPLFWFFSRVENTVSRAQFCDFLIFFSGWKDSFSGTVLKFFSGRTIFFSGTLSFHSRLFGFLFFGPVECGWWNGVSTWKLCRGAGGCCLVTKSTSEGGVWRKKKVFLWGSVDNFQKYERELNLYTKYK